MHTNEEITAVLEALVAEEGEDYRYKDELNTLHKRKVGIKYSYDDCIVGCVFRALEPELHKEFLAHEEVEESSFPISEQDPPVGSARQLFTQVQMEGLAAAQGAQDTRQTWGAALDVWKAVIKVA